MQRLSIVCNRVSSPSRQNVARITRSQYTRRLTTETASPSSAVTPPPTQKKRRIIRRLLFYSSVLTMGVYGAGTLAALRNERFHDFFVEFVPYGERILDTADQYGWEGHPVHPQEVLEAGRAATDKLELIASTSASNVQAMVEKARSKTQVSSQREAAESLKATLKRKSTSDTDKAHILAPDVAADIKEVPASLFEDVTELVAKAETALANDGMRPHTAGLPTSSQSISENDDKVFPDKRAYTSELPLGFEPPPGFILPSIETTPEVPIHPSPEIHVTSLPLVAPAVSDLSSSEPVLSQLANTIDNLAAFLKDNPSATVNSGVKEVLGTAQADLLLLGERLGRMKDEEKAKLEDKLEDQAREYSVKLLQLEMDAQDKLDLQEEDWQRHFDQERQHVIRDYRAKLEAELKAQSEIINERLKEEVIAQGIELQRRWIREIKVRVEEERGGRLAKLDELAADLQRLSRITSDNSAYLDENIRLHALWSSIRTLNAIVQDSSVRKPFRKELRILRHVAIAGGARENPVLAVALETLEDSDVPDVGVEPFADLASWFMTSVAPRVSAVALVPDQNAGVLSHLASSLLSSIRFQPRGFVKGEDVLSVLARAEYYMNEKDLDSAARELNQLKGPAKLLLKDWLHAARKRLEVLQAIEVVQSHATLASLLLV